MILNIRFHDNGDYYMLLLGKYKKEKDMLISKRGKTLFKHIFEHF